MRMYSSCICFEELRKSGEFIEKLKSSFFALFKENFDIPFVHTNTAFLVMYTTYVTCCVIVFEISTCNLCRDLPWK